MPEGSWSILLRGSPGMLIYDPKVSDPQMIRLLKQQSAKESICVIGRVGKAGTAGLKARHASHCRAMVRDRTCLLVSLREEELDERREVGVIVSDPAIANMIRSTFDAD
jgi:hypothetical protein